MVDPVRGKIRIEIIPWLTRYFGQRGSARLILEEGIDKEIRMVDFLASLSSKYPAVGEAIIDLQSGRLFDHVEIVHNDVLLGGKEALEQVVRDGDSLVFLPAFVGG
ncbi:MAG: hypothetical protein Q7O66_11695 [Dehalococcoidia bacterium]|nr:hypothetical protein [Dehalococcoidia bacterium]